MSIFKKEIMAEMKEYFGTDEKRISHTQEVTKYAQRLLESENGNPDVIVPAATLHDIGIKVCEEKYNSTSGQLQEKEGPPIARNILLQYDIAEKIVDEICDIISSHHSPGEIESDNFYIIWDADWLVNLRDEYDIKDKKKLKKIIKNIFKTDTGRKLAEEIYL